MRKATAKMIIPATVTVRPSTMRNGVGLFSLRKIEKGEVICRWKKVPATFFLPMSEYKKLDPITKSQFTDFCPQDEKGFYVPLDINYSPRQHHMNHSCNGNIGLDTDDNFVAIKKIKKQEELCFDYSLVISNPEYKLVCNCGSKKCRKIITGNDWKNLLYTKENYRYMSFNLKKLCRKFFPKHFFESV